MISNKAQEMSIQTVVVLILIMIVLVVVIAFAVPQITNLFSGLSDIGTDVSDQVGDSSSYECASLNVEGCGACTATTKEACNAIVHETSGAACCDWKLKLI